MGLHNNLNCLVIVLVAHQIFPCLALDLISGNFRRPRNSESIQVRGIYSFDNAYKKQDPYNKTSSSRNPVHWKWKRAGTDVNNHKYGNYFLRNHKWDTKLQTTATPLIKGNYISLYPRYLSRSTTPSYIEFDYLDENQDQDHYYRFGFGDGIPKVDNDKPSRTVNVHPSSVSYHLFDNPYMRQELVTSPIPILSTNLQNPLSYSYFQPANKFKINRLGISTINHSNYRQKVPATKNNTTLMLPTHFTTSTKPSISQNDRVKFFEIYDSDTLKPPIRMIEVNERSEIKNYTTYNVLENVSQSDNNNEKVGLSDDTNNNTKIEVKHNYKKRSFDEEDDSALTNQIEETIVPTLLYNSMSKKTLTIQTEDGFSKSESFKKTAVVPWSSYPFASVYVYKPTQTHCDAAGISAHWLLASGACLSHQASVHSLYARSAFVTYCGEHWRRPERIAYVKRSVVHPKFNPKDKKRRVLYNIGLIQVSNSMAAACQGWSPVALMSHRFTTQPEGTEATAVGWGLDRYGTKYTAEKLPHWPLTGYKALVYSDKCPGSSSYRTAMDQDGDETSNVYCLVLPLYTNEDSDPVHGGMLLVGEKLVAVYLQEERHSRGPQSAQYTGVWRLLPWVMDIAHEPDDAEATFDV